jgi:2-amino-4-hydroxy-6-hydroxymethyldihydropteridine diphosphokinase
VRNRHWGERTLDIDILLYGEQLIELPQLIVPHRELARRAFVLYPLYQIAPHLQLPKYGSLRDLLEHCPAIGLTRLS